MSRCDVQSHDRRALPELRHAPFHQMFRAACEECAITRAALAALTGISEGRIAAFESGEAMPTASEVLQCLGAWDYSFRAAPPDFQATIVARGEPSERVAAAIEEIFERAERERFEELCDKLRAAIDGSEEER
jgi:transcriptional regulator with XRE-family HTH domain